jgi:RNA polymerase sigma-70 factor (ECF subfamily)
MPESCVLKAELDDAELVRAVQVGQIESFEPLVDRHLGAVRAFLSLKAPVPQLIDELAHETFLFAFRHLSEFKAGTSFRNWLRAIAWNLLRAEILRYSRRQVHAERLKDFWLVECMESEALAGTDTDFLEECLDLLPSHARNLLDLHYREGFDSTEIAAKTARSRSWVRTTMFRLRQELKSCIEGKRASVPS